MPGFCDSGYASAQNDERWVSAGRERAGRGLPGCRRVGLWGKRRRSQGCSQGSVCLDGSMARGEVISVP